MSITLKRTAEGNLKALRQIAKQLGYAPSSLEARKRGISVSYLYKIYKRSWGGILELADCSSLPTRDRRLNRGGLPSKITIADLKNDVRRVARQLGRFPRQDEYDLLGRHCHQTITRRLGTWEEVIKSCGLLYRKPKPPRSLVPKQSKNVSDSQIREELKRVANVLGHYPSPSEFQSHGNFSTGMMYRRAKARTWRAVLTHFLSLAPEELATCARTVDRLKTTEERLGEVRQLAEKLGRCPSCKEAIRAGINMSTLRDRVKGGWAAILSEAGLSSLGLPRRGRPRRNNISLFDRKTPVLKGLGNVQDPVRDMLKTSSVEAIKSFFQGKSTPSGSI